MNLSRPLVVFFFFSSSLIAQPMQNLSLSDFNHDSWTTDQGLPQNTVLTVTQTTDGYLWLATYEGLVRFNGFEFKVFDQDNTPNLTSKSIISLFADNDSSLWIGTRYGLNHYQHGAIVKSYTVRNGLNNDFIRAILKTKEGLLFIGTDEGLSILKNDTLINLSTKNGLAGNTISALAEDKNHGIWIGTDLGLTRYFNGEFTNYSKPEGLPNSYIRSLLYDKKGRLWIGTSGGARVLENDKISEIPNAGNFHKQPVTAIYEDNSGHFWFGNDTGLEFYNGSKTENMTTQDELTSNRIRAVYQDKEGSIWVGTNFGLNRLHRAKFGVITIKKGLSDDYVRTVLEDSKGNLWVGASEGLNRINNEKITVFNTKNGLAGDEILSLAEDKTGAIWIGTANGGVSVFRNGSFKTINDKNGLPSNIVRALFSDSKGNVWIGTTRGLVQWSNNKMKILTTQDGLSSSYILSITEDKNGVIWVGTSVGINTIKDAAITAFKNVNDLFQPNVFSIFPDERGNVLLGTDNGLYYMKDGQFTRLTTKNGLYDNVGFAILQDEKRSLWITCNRGIYEVLLDDIYKIIDGKSKNLTTASYGKSDGLKTSQCNGSSQPAGWKSKDGRLWFATAKGIAFFNPAKSSGKNDVAPPVIIEQVVAYNESVSLDGKLELAPGNKKFEFHYAGLSYLVPEKVRFKYKLEGFDEEWVDVGTRRVAYYTNLAPKEYTFRVIASNNDGVWNETGASVSFVLTPYFYQTVWFYVLLGIAVTGGVFGFYRYRVQSLKNREVELRHLVNVRTKDILEEKNKTEIALIENEKARQAINEKSNELEDTIIKLKETQSQLIQSEKMASLGQLTAGIAHEINNPINFVHSNIEPLKRDFSQLVQIINEYTELEKLEDRVEREKLIRQLETELELDQLKEEIPLLIRGIEDGAKRTAEIVRGLRDFSRMDESINKKTNINDGLDSTLKLLKNKLEHRIEIVRDFQDLPEIECHPGQLNQVFMNVISNAIDAIPGKGTVTIKTSHHADKTVTVKISDTGIGMSEDVKRRIFDPFFTTKPIGKGTGLGLSVSYGIINKHKGKIEVISEPGKGTDIIIIIPVSQS